MCWSCRASIFGLIFAWSCAAMTCWLPAPTHEVKSTHQWFIALFGVVALIQLIEAGLWRTIGNKKIIEEDKKTRINILTRCIYCCLWLQIVTNCFCLIYFGLNSSFSAGFAQYQQKKEPWWAPWYCWAIIGASASEIGKAIFDPAAKKWTTFVGSHGHLIWCSALAPKGFLKDTEHNNNRINSDVSYVPQFSFWSTMVYMIGLYFPLFWLPAYKIVTLSTVFLALAYAWLRSSQGETGSHWCYLGAFLSATPLIMYTKTQLLG
jgi:hypothetical protein